MTKSRISFSLGFLFFLFFPTAPILFFVPFLIFMSYQLSFSSVLWLSVVCGIIVDLFSVETRFGFHSLQYVLSILVVFRFHKYFFVDQKLTIPLLTFLFCLITKSIEILSIKMTFPKQFVFSSLILDLLWEIFWTCFFSWVCFSLLFPLFLSEKKQIAKKKARFFRMRKKRAENKKI